MRQKAHHFSTLKLILIGIFIVFCLLFVLRSSSFSSFDQQNSSAPTSQIIFPNIPTKDEKATNCSPTCTKIPPSLAQALLHYTTSSTTPQQTLKEISLTATVLQKRSPCNFLVFGLGHNSLMWSALNHGGCTVFLEEDEGWNTQIKRRFATLESYLVTYDSKVSQADALMEVGKGPECTEVGQTRSSKCQLALKGLPDKVYEVKWDLIMVDGPTGYNEDAPGRMIAIYTAGMMARNREDDEESTDVFVQNVDRDVEDKFCRVFLCDGYVKKQEGKLRHYRIPSHRDALNKPFCP